jgi:hypothetical protein
VKVLRADKAFDKTFLVRRLGRQPREESASSEIEDPQLEEVVDTSQNDSSASLGDSLQVMKLFDRSKT